MSAAPAGELPGADRLLIWFNDPGNWRGPGGLLADAGQHLAYTGLFVGLAVAVGLPLGLLIGHTGRGDALVAGAANALRAIPALGLLVFLIVVLSPHIGVRTGVAGLVPPGGVPYFVPALIVLTLVALPPVVTGTSAGVRSLDPAVRDAAHSTGMTRWQVATRVELPCAAPLIVAGIRSATLQVVATLSVAAYAPLLGGLGRMIVDGQQNLTDPRYGYPAMLAAGIAVAVIAVTADLLLALAGRLVASPGLAAGGTRRRSAVPARARRPRRGVLPPGTAPALPKDSP